MDVELMEVEDPRWKEELAAQRHDFYHLPDYLKLCATSASGRPVALYARSGEGRLLVPLILRDIDGHGIPECAGLRDAISPYGYPGPLVVLPPGPPEQGREFLVQALAAGIGLLREQRIVSAFIRSHPLLGFDTAVFAKAGEVVHHGETVSIDTTLDEAGRWSQIRNDHRSGIKKALLSGQVVEFDDQWRELDAFVSIYNHGAGQRQRRLLLPARVLPPVAGCPRRPTASGHQSHWWRGGGRSAVHRGRGHRPISSQRHS